MNTKKQRESKYELLRICAMIFIISHHYCVHGIMHCTEKQAYIDWYNGNLLNRFLACLLEPGGNIGIALFFIITGYFLCEKKNIGFIKVISETIFYSFLCVLISIIFYVFGWSVIELTKTQMIGYLFKGIFLPISGENMGFATAYIILMILVPTLNEFYNKINNNKKIILLLFFWIFWYSFGEFAGVRYLYIQKAVFFYLIGSSIKQYHFKGNESKLYYFLISILLWFLSSIVLYQKDKYMMDMNLKALTISNVLSVAFVSFFVPLIAITIFLLFQKLNIKNSKLVNKISQATFGVYLIHDSVFIKYTLWNRMIDVDVHFQSDFFLMYAIGTIILVFVLCGMLDVLWRFFSIKMYSVIFRLFDFLFT